MWTKFNSIQYVSFVAMALGFLFDMSFLNHPRGGDGDGDGGGGGADGE